MISKGRRQNLQLQVFQGHTLKRERSPPGVRNKSDQSWIKQYRPNVCTAQVFFRKTSSLGVMILGSGGFGRWSETRVVFMKEMCTLIKGAHRRRPLPLSSKRGYNKKMAVSKPGRRFSSEARSSSTWSKKPSRRLVMCQAEDACCWETTV